MRDRHGEASPILDKGVALSTRPKDVLATGKVLWLEKAGEKSSPLKYVAEGNTVYVLLNGKHERVPPLSDGDQVTVVGHPLAKQTRAGSARAVVRRVPPHEVPDAVLVELAGPRYDPTESVEQNLRSLRESLIVASLSLS